MQKTSFPVEIIIHDDASTDGTAEIVRDYAKKYSEKIVPLFQKENQNSNKQGSIYARFVWPHSQGKYIALCEGDDYWTDPHKLQKQVEILTKYPECNICFHPTLEVDETGSKGNEVTAHFGDLS